MCGTDAHARNYSLLLSGPSVRLAPLYDLNSHLAYTDGQHTELSMGLLGNYRAARMTVSDWASVADSLHVGPRWMAEEIDRQVTELVSTMEKVAGETDISRYDSPVVARLLENTGRWVTRLR